MTVYILWTCGTKRLVLAAGEEPPEGYTFKGSLRCGDLEEAKRRLGG